ncbi:MAG: SPFH domain-containing protein [Pseudomonadota bacterium]
MGGVPLILIVVVILAVLAFVTLVAAIARYRRCPSDRILVKFGKVGKGESAQCIHGGASFIWPLLQSYGWLDLAPMTIDIKLRGALSKQNIRVNVPSRFTIGISTEPSIMALAAERLLSMDRAQIVANAEDIIFGQLRATIATMDIEEINADREGFERRVMNNVESELKKIGLKLINVNITDITDESDYISALGKKAAAEAIEKAKVAVAQQVRDGETGKAEAERDQRVSVATANARAVEGENTAEIAIANSNASRREAEAEAQRKGDAAEKVKTADALREAYGAEQRAEQARRQREEATQEADRIVPAEIAKREKIIQAEADKEKAVLEGRARGEAVQADMAGQGKGMESILQGQAEGFRQLVTAAGGSSSLAVQFLIANKLEELMNIQVEAIKGIAIDQVTVWESGSGKDGKTATADFISGMAKSVPPLQDLMGLAGMQLPEWMAKTMPGGPDAPKPPTTPPPRGER